MGDGRGSGVRRGRRAAWPAAVAAALAVPALCWPAPAASQAEDPPATVPGSPTSSTSTSTTRPAPSPSPTLLPPTSTTTPPAQEAPAPVDPVDEADADAPPPVRPVPPRSVPRPLTPVDVAVALATKRRVQEAEVRAAAAQQELFAAQGRIFALESAVADLRSQLDGLSQVEAQAVATLDRARKLVASRAVAVYVAGGEAASIPIDLDPYQFGRRQVLIESAQAADKARVEAFQEAKRQAGDDLVAIVDRLSELEGQLIGARGTAAGAGDRFAQATAATNQAAAALRVGPGGFAFPVARPFSFISSFGAPRSGGRSHQGNDIFAPEGTPLLAAERGIVERMGVNALGGIKLWIVGESGTTYYYAHLQAFVEGVVDGTLVEAGDVVGFVGKTGNAQTTPPHLHFEIHPDGGPAIDPYPILRAAADAVLAVGAPPPAAGQAVAPPASSTSSSSTSSTRVAATRR